MSITLDIVEQEQVFMSILEDVHELDVQTKLDGMSFKQASSIVRQARTAGHQARTQGLPNGNYQVIVDDRIVLENKQQWKLYQLVLPSSLGDMSIEDTLAEKAGVSLGTVLDFKQKNRRSLDYYSKRLKPTTIENIVEEERDLTELTQADIADMTGSQAVNEPTLQMSAEQKRAYAEYLNPTGQTPHSFGGDNWKFVQAKRVRVNNGAYKVA